MLARPTLVSYEKRKEEKEMLIGGEIKAEGDEKESEQ